MALNERKIHKVLDASGMEVMQVLATLYGTIAADKVAKAIMNDDKPSGIVWPRFD